MPLFPTCTCNTPTTHPQGWPITPLYPPMADWYLNCKPCHVLESFPYFYIGCWNWLPAGTRRNKPQRNLWFSSLVHCLKLVRCRFYQTTSSIGVSESQTCPLISQNVRFHLWRTPLCNYYSTQGWLCGLTLFKAHDHSVKITSIKWAASLSNCHGRFCSIPSGQILLRTSPFRGLFV